MCTRRGWHLSGYFTLCQTARTMHILRHTKPDKTITKSLYIDKCSGSSKPLDQSSLCNSITLIRTMVHGTQIELAYYRHYGRSAKHGDRQA